MRNPSDKYISADTKIDLDKYCKLQIIIAYKEKEERKAGLEEGLFLLGEILHLRELKKYNDQFFTDQMTIETAKKVLEREYGKKRWKHIESKADDKSAVLHMFKGTGIEATVYYLAEDMWCEILLDTGVWFADNLNKEGETY